MKKQKGAALIVVLSLLVVSLMLGLSSMQSSQIDERLAGNYKLQSEAQMAAEFAGAIGLERLNDEGPYFTDFNPGGAKSDFIKTYDLDETSFARFSEDFCDSGDHMSEGLSKGCFSFLRLSGGSYIAAKGVVESGQEELAVSSVLLLSLLGGGDLRNVINTVFQCEVSDESCDGDVKYSGSANEAADTIRNEKVSVNPDIFDDANQFTMFLDELKNLSKNADEGNGDRLVHYFNSFGGNMDLSDYSGNIVVVDGNFTWGGRDDFEGLLIVTGDILRYSGAGQPSDMKGAIIHAPTNCPGEGCGFIKPTIRIDGGIGDLEYSPEIINDLLARLDSSLPWNPIGAWDGSYTIHGWE